MVGTDLGVDHLMAMGPTCVELDEAAARRDGCLQYVAGRHGRPGLRVHDVG